MQVHAQMSILHGEIAHGNKSLIPDMFLSHARKSTISGRQDNEMSQHMVAPIHLESYEANDAILHYPAEGLPTR